MSPKDTIPPERIDARLVALSVQVEGLSRIVLALEGSVRDLCGSVREVLAELRAQQQRAAQPHPVAEALIALIRGVANDGRGRLLIAGGFAVLCAGITVVLLSWAAPAALNEILVLADHHLPGEAHAPSSP